MTGTTQTEGRTDSTILRRATKHGYEKVILRLVRNADAQRAIKAGEIDAIVDVVSGKAILLPDAQLAMLESGALAQGRVTLVPEPTWTWEQDAAYRFVAQDSGRFCGQNINGKALWDLAMDTVGETSWQSHRQQLEWHAAFSDLEVSCVDQSGNLRYFSLDGDPVHDRLGHCVGYHGSTREITRSRQLQIDSQEPERIAGYALDALTCATCVLDANGTVLLANAGWRNCSGTRTGISAGIGSSFLAACDNARGDDQLDATAIAAGLRQVIAGSRAHFQCVLGRTTAGVKGGFRLSITRIAEIGSAARAVVSLEDMTAQRDLEQLLQLESDVMRGLLDARSAHAGLTTTIQSVCAAMRWDCGRYFRLDAAAGILRFDAGWGREDAAVELFMAQSRHLAFRPGAGLAGRAFESAQPIWAAAGASDTDPSVLAPETGHDGSLAIPVTLAGLATGVLAFSGHNIREPDDRMLRMMQAIAAALGRFLHDQLAIEALAASAARFRRLTEISADWYWEQDRECRFASISRGHSGRGHAVLGARLWELPGIVAPIVSWEEHRAQVSARWSYCDFEYAFNLEDGQQRHFSISGEPVYDELGEFTGYCGTGVDITQRKHAASALNKLVTVTRHPESVPLLGQHSAIAAAE